MGVDVLVGRLVDLQRQEILPGPIRGKCLEHERLSPSTKPQEAWAERGAFDDRWKDGRKEP